NASQPPSPHSIKQMRKCLFFVEKKKRRCKMEAGKDKLYCGEHGFMEKGSRRIVCPLDPKHTVCEDKLHTHMLKCNVYYVENINAGAAVGDVELPQVNKQTN
uniref:tRNA:m(4)X modification enzyme TRM13 n=1 Tax=Gouania willdenowi TaxID=441366 RepID=A0A8C5D1H2_GOUWI